MYDLIIRGGTILDPSIGVEEVGDVCIGSGRVQAITKPMECHAAARELDAAGCYVSPGFVDAHLHLNASSNPLGVKPDLACLSGGVTTAIDAGSAGFWNFPVFYSDDIIPSITTVKAVISPTNKGVQDHPNEEDQDPAGATPERLRPFFLRYSDVLVGIKIRVHAGVTGRHGLKALEQAAATSALLKAEGRNCRLMIHFGNLDKGIALADVLAHLDAGDVFTHIYRPGPGSTIFDEEGRVQDCVLRARERGVIFESGCARTHLSLDSVAKGFAQGFHPQIISTDIVRHTLYWAPSGWLALKMSLYLCMGMALREVVRAVTQSPAEVYHLDCGTLAPGSSADLTVFRVEGYRKRLDDLYGGSLELERMIVPMATIKGGRIVFQQVYL